MNIRNKSSNNHLQEWASSDRQPVVKSGEVHVWRIPLDRPSSHANHYAVLSAEEQRRVARFHFPEHAQRYTVAHGALRHILGMYLSVEPHTLAFETGAHGKPHVIQTDNSHRQLHFNLSHSANLALVAVSTTGEVGVDVEEWREDVRHVEVAERFFSASEHRELMGLGEDAPAVMQGFFAGWSRKEAYIKASGFGITRGLDHFDVSLHPAAPASILEDRFDPAATDRWSIANLDVGPGFSAAIVATAPLNVIRLYHSPTF